MNTVESKPLLRSQQQTETLNRALDDLLDDIFEGRIMGSASIVRTIVGLAEESRKTYSQVVDHLGLRLEAHRQKGTYTTERIAALPDEIRSYFEWVRPMV